MKSLLSLLALAFGALTFQSCEDYPNGASRGSYHGGYYGGGYGRDHYASTGYYGDAGYGPTVIVSSGDRSEHHHGDGYNNEYYGRENDHGNVNRNSQVNRNVNANGTVNANANRNVRTNQNVHGNPKVHANPNRHRNPNAEVRQQ